MYEQLVTGELARSFYTARNSLAFQVIGRMQRDVSLDQARQAMKAMAKRLEEGTRRKRKGAAWNCSP